MFYTVMPCVRCTILWQGHANLSTLNAPQCSSRCSPTFSRQSKTFVLLVLLVH